MSLSPSEFFFDRGILEKSFQMASILLVVTNMQIVLKEYKISPVADKDKIAEREEMINDILEYCEWASKVWEAGRMESRLCFNTNHDNLVLRGENAELKKQIKQLNEQAEWNKP